MQHLFLALSLVPMALSQSVRFWRDEGCPSDAADEAFIDLILPATNDDCLAGQTILPGWETDLNGDYLTWFTGDGIPSDCTLGILEQSTIDTGTCGTVIFTQSGGTVGACKQVTLPAKFGMDTCCGGTDVCDPSLPVKRDTTQKQSARDVTMIKRSIPFAHKRADCSFAGTEPYESRAAQQIVSDRISCAGAAGDDACPFTASTEITTGTLDSFGVTTEAGASFFEIVQASVSFSYEYSYEESKTVSQAYNINVPAGQTGVITWTPTVICTDGTFSGDTCGDWTVNSPGTACIPELLDGVPTGLFSFVQQA